MPPPLKKFSFFWVLCGSCTLCKYARTYPKTMMSQGKRLELYTLKRPGEVLLVTVAIAPDEEDQVVIFKGFSSSLVRSTAFDPDVPVIADDVTILSIDRLQGPYNPDAPQYLERGISWENMQRLLTEMGL